jgi:hypothetical protein
LTVLEVQGLSRFGAAITINPDGTLRYDPTASATLLGLPDGLVRNDRFTYTVTDQLGARSTAIVAVTVTGQAPVPASFVVSDARTPRRAAAVPVEEEMMIDLAAEFGGFEAPAGGGGTSSWQVDFVAEGPGSDDPNKKIAISIEMVA